MKYFLWNSFALITIYEIVRILARTTNRDQLILTYFADENCQNPFDQIIKTNPFKIHQRIGNKFLIEFYGDPYSGTVGENDVYEITGTSIDTTAEKVDLKMTAEKLLSIKLNGYSVKPC